MSYAKGKKAIPRVFRHLSNDQRTNVLTVAIAHLDTIDVVHGALVSPIPAAVKEEIELFINTVIPVLFSHLNEQPLFIIAGLLGIILSRCDVKSIVRTKVGLSLLTMLISRAEVLKENRNKPRTAMNGSNTPRCIMTSSTFSSPCYRTFSQT
jgi:DNA topoisomerase 2-associated protein PAT1